ncbi:MAG: flagellar basal body-associated FliL family protein [Bdellovibrionaceae bacterium]|nr:flagellar basal body-associated FliL family protein [Pseudobdellovibrionaceae bacterium]
MAEEKEQGQSAKKPRNMGAIMGILFAVVNLGITGAGAYMVYASTIGWEAPKLTEEDLTKDVEQLVSENLAPYIYKMDKFTVNLGGEPKRTIRIEVQLEMLGPEGLEEIMDFDNRSRARDLIVRMLNSKTFSEIESIQGKLELKSRITQEITGILKSGIVKEVYFTDFVVQ